MAQTVPQAINYQAEARNANGKLFTNRSLGIQAKYHNVTSTGTVSYTETFSVTTNGYGLFTVMLGTGTPTSGTFAGVPFSTNSIYLEISMDTTGGTSYVSMGTTQFLTVPYSLVAQTAATATNSTNSWSIAGNAGTNSSTNFIGTTDTAALRFRVNNVKAGEINYNTGNVALGYSANASTTSGSMNVAIGHDALFYNTTGDNNTAIGYRALWSDTTGYGNTAIGSATLYSNTSGYSNTAIGRDALKMNNSSFNTGVGFESLSSNTSGSNNTALGSFALVYNTTGNYNTAFGVSALYSNTTGSENIAVGYQALYSNISGLYNVALGVHALKSNTGNNNIAIGHDALFNSSTSSNNTAVGWSALHENTTGIDNCAFGYGALYDNITGNSNVGIGWASGYHATGNNNVLIGYYAGYTTSADYNVGVGYSVLSANTSGQNNSAFGSKCLISNTTGGYNTAAGNFVLAYNSTGTSNTGLGNYAGNINTTGSNNTFLGDHADAAGNNLSNATAVGYGAIVDAPNKVRIGSVAVSSIGGQVGWSAFSDGRVKNNVNQNVPGLDFIKILRPVTYNYDIKKENELLGIKNDTANWEGKYDIEKMTFSGFIAQEVDTAAQKIGYNFSGVDKSGNIWGLRYSDFVPSLVKAVQELNTQVDQLNAINKNLVANNNLLQQQIAAIKRADKEKYANIMARLEKMETVSVKSKQKNGNKVVKK